MTPIQEYMEQDHARLDVLLRESIESNFKASIYNEFRAGLLRHIAIEEKILFPLLRSNPERTETLNKLRLQHGALGALLVPKGTQKIGSTIRSLLESHNLIEEGAAGVYSRLELSKEDAESLLQQLRSFPAVPLSPAMDRLEDLGPVRRAMERAGFDPSRI